MYLFKSGDTFVLRCSCKAVSLTLCDDGVEVNGTVTCSACGTEAEWGTMVDEAEAQASEHDAEKESRPSAEVHVLYS